MFNIFVNVAPLSLGSMNKHSVTYDRVFITSFFVQTYVRLSSISDVRFNLVFTLNRTSNTPLVYIILVIFLKLGFPMQKLSPRFRYCCVRLA
jgi:hypothetical protein